MFSLISANCLQTWAKAREIVFFYFVRLSIWKLSYCFHLWQYLKSKWKFAEHIYSGRFIRGGHPVRSTYSPLGTQRRSAQPCFHQSTSSIVPYRRFDLRLASQCRALIGTDATRRKKGPRRVERAILTWQRACRGFGAGWLRKICRLTCELGARSHQVIRKIAQVITKVVYLHANGLASRWCMRRVQCVDQTRRFFLGEKGWRTANIFCNIFTRNFRFLGSCLESSFSI